MNTSPEIGELAKALAAAQGEFPAITRNREVTVKSDKGSYKFEYATLDHILELTKEARVKHGLALSWGCRCENGCVIIAGRLVHSSGQWIESALLVPLSPGMKDQVLGSEMTYRKRYIADQLLGLSASDDDDANLADGNEASFKPRGKATAKAASEVDSFPPSGPIGKAPARPSDAPKPSSPAAGPPMTREALEALPLLDLCKIHAQKFGRASTNEEIGAMNGDLANKDRFGLDPEGVLLLRKQLIGMLVGGDK